jgi:PKD repeat protein
LYLLKIDKVKKIFTPLFKIGILFLFIFNLNQAEAQRHQWAKSFPKTGGIATNIAIDSNNSVYMTGLFHDTLRFDSTTILPPLTAPFQGNFFSKFDSRGKFLWSKAMYIKTNSTRDARFYISGIQVLTNNKIAVFGYFQDGIGALKLTSNDSIVGGKGQESTGFIAVFDSTGSLLNYKKVYDGLNYDWFYGNGIGSRLEKDQQNNLYIQFYKSEDTKGYLVNKGGDILLNDTIPRYMVVKYPPGLDSVIWYKNFPDARQFRVQRLSIGEDNNLYLGCNALGGPFTLNGTRYNYAKFRHKGFISVLNPAGAFIFNKAVNRDSLNGDELVEVIARDTNHVYILGYFEDSLDYNGKWYVPTNPNSKGDFFPYLARVKLNGNAKWVKIAKDRTSVMLYNATPSFGKLAFDKQGNIYASFYYWRNGLSIGGLTDSSIVNIAFTKFDSLGNALWLQSMPNQLEYILPDYDTNIVYTGSFHGKTDFYPFKLKIKYTSTYLAKLLDFSIKRGRVKYGPYCAGDSIFIPYSKRGIYDTANYFVAELSDENGDFEGKERELGRVKSMYGGQVRAVLPNFKVASSGKYRIRIRSTAPQIQSFYEKDTLRLLIYSRDKADPGPTETICYGDTISIETFGGTRWTWSPEYNMSDSTQRKVTVWPYKTTNYKIIIADSSGCGAPDTSYKRIIVHRPLKVNLPFTDSLLCFSNAISIPVGFTGGDSLNYSWKWYYVNTPKQWFDMSSGANKLTDTIVYTPSNPVEKLAIILKDNCTDKNDTALVNLGIRTPITILSNIRDTVLCGGNRLLIKPNANGGNPDKYRWVWQNAATSQVISNLDSLDFTPTQSIKIKVQVSDGCSNLNDEKEFTVTVKAPLETSILIGANTLLDTTICFNQSLNLKGFGKGGNSMNYRFNWYLDSKLVSSKSTLLLEPLSYYSSTGGLKTLSLVLNDNCTQNPDTVSVKIKVLEAPKAAFTVDNYCLLSPVKFAFKGSKPDAPITTTFSWNFASEAMSTAENPNYQFKTSGNKMVTLKLISSNSCTDTAIKSIDVLPQVKADFEAQDVCEDSLATFINKSGDVSGKTNYKWSFGDGKTSLTVNPKHLYQIGGLSQTFNVKLSAKVVDGCADSITKAVTINANPKAGFQYKISGLTVTFTSNENNASKYNWNFGDGTNTSVTTKTVVHAYNKLPVSIINVCLELENLAGCKSDSCIDVLLTSQVRKILKSDIQVFPNPNNGFVTITIPFSGFNYAISTLSSNLVKEGVFNSGQQLLELPNQAGVYILKIANTNESYYWRVVVIK